MSKLSNLYSVNSEKQFVKHLGTGRWSSLSATLTRPRAWWLKQYIKATEKAAADDPIIAAGRAYARRLLAEMKGGEK